MAVTKIKLLKIAHFADLQRWSVQFSAFGYKKNKFPFVLLSSVLKRAKEPIYVMDGMRYKRITIRNNGRGVEQRDELQGKEIGTKRQFVARAGQLIISRIDVRNGAVGIVPKELDGAIVTNDFWLFDVHDAIPKFLMLLLSSASFQKYWQTQSSGTTNRQRLSEAIFLNSRISLPDIGLQERLVETYSIKIKTAIHFEACAQGIDLKLNDFLFNELGIKEKSRDSIKHILWLTSFVDLHQWGVDKNITSFPYKFEKYKPFSFASKPIWIKALFRGKSPKYNGNATGIILNQKCNRLDRLDLTFARTVDDGWLNRWDNDHLTKKNDILINSTGEGTIGRASLVTKEFAGLAYDSHMLLLRVNPKLVDAQIIVDLLNSPLGKRQIELYKSAQATTQTELGVENTKKLLFPLPDLVEQKRISRTVSEMTKEKAKLLKNAECHRKAAIKDFVSGAF